MATPKIGRYPYVACNDTGGTRTSRTQPVLWQPAATTDLPTAVDQGVAPAAVKGDLIYDDTLDMLLVWNGTAFESVAAPGLSSAELAFLNGALAGDVVASKAVIADSSGRIADTDLNLFSTNAMSVSFGTLPLFKIDDASMIAASVDGGANANGSSTFIRLQRGGTPTGNGTSGGSLTINAGPARNALGAGTTGGVGGGITLANANGGDGSATGTGGAGGSLTVTAGNGGATSGAGTGGAGGDISLTAGTGGTTSGGTAGTNGAIRLIGPVTYKQGNVTAKTTAVTLTIAELLTGIITGTHTAGATQAYTLPTGTLSDAGVSDGVGTNEGFYWTLINLSAAAADTITVTAGTDHTLVGEGIVQSSHSTTGQLYGSSARFFTRKTAANTFVTYRVG